MTGDTDTTVDDLMLVEAVAEGLHDEMARDESVVVLGEDVGQSGGVFRATEGLHEAFDEERVIDTPLTETGIAGAAVGLAASGLRPVMEIQFMGFTYAALEQLYTRAARLHARSRGQYPCQLVVRAPFGGGVRAPDLHGESMEAIFVHHPGFKVVVPSTPRDAKGLLIASIRDPDPVVFLEPKKIYRAFREAVPEEPYETPLGEAAVRREGSDVTAVTWGAMTRPTLDAAEDLAGEIDVEVIDLRTLSPMDRETMVDSFEKTGRAVVVHEAPRTGGLAGEVVATLQEEALLYQEAPVGRVTGWDVVYPLYDLEDFQLPNATRVREKIREIVAF
jgi:pyruvate dehydrogenase E1 component beta subunit